MLRCTPPVARRMTCLPRLLVALGLDRAFSSVEILSTLRVAVLFISLIKQIDAGHTRSR